MSGYQIEQSSFDAPAIEPGLYIVATPIGNLRDITIRALQTLAGVDCIACEDTRVTGKLLARYAIKKRMIAYHEHNAERAGSQILTILKSGGSVALVSDAGTPLISDPGYRLVEQARQARHRVFPIPGSSAPLAALVASGLPTDIWSFVGFLPPKKAARQARLEQIRALPGSVVFFESPRRLAALLGDMIDVFGESRLGSVSRELTKLHEETLTGTLAELSARFGRSEERRVGKECRSRWSPYH